MVADLRVRAQRYRPVARLNPCLVGYGGPVGESTVGPSEAAERKAENSTALDHVARVGMVTYGLVHLVVAWLVFRLALGDSSGSASGTGALRQLAQTPAGRIPLYVVAAGFLALAGWHAVEAVLGYRRESDAKRWLYRLLSAAKLVVFGGIAAYAVIVAAGASSGGDGTDSLTARVMSLPAGTFLVGGAGLGIMVAAGVLAYYGLGENFRELTNREGQRGVTGRVLMWVGKAGYVTRGLAVAMVGALFVYSAATHDPDEAGGLDQALQTVVDQPFGSPLLVALAAGIACYGLFCFTLITHLDR